MTSATNERKRPSKQHQQRSSLTYSRVKSVNNIGSAATPLCSVRIGPTRTQSLIDTGADCSVIRYDIYKKIPKGCIVKTFKISTPPCVSATGNPLEIVAEARIKFQLGRVPLEHTFKVAKNLRKTLILGSDFLGANGASIDFKKRELNIGGKYVILGNKAGKRSDGKLHLPAVILEPQSPTKPTLDKSVDAGVVVKSGEVRVKADKKRKRRRRKQPSSKATPLERLGVPVECPDLVSGTDSGDEHPMLAEIAPETEPMIGGAYPDIGTSNPEERRSIMELLQSNSHMFAENDLELGTTHLMLVFCKKSV